MSNIVEKASGYVFGIDLGTTNTSIAVYKKGAPDVINIEGSKVMPSVVSIHRDGGISVGSSARNRSLIDPENTVSSVKRFMGSPWKKIFEHIPNKEFTPIDISAEILKKLINEIQVNNEAEYGGAPRFVTICIPANFTDLQRKATAEAGRAAGMEVLTLLEEPVAAAYAYAVEKERDQTILIYDLGGGTFDVSILKVNSGAGQNQKFSVLAKEGIQHLGGDDIDAVLLEQFAKTFEKDSGIDLRDVIKDQGVSPRRLKEAQQKLLDAVIRAKHELSDTETTVIEIPNLITDGSGTTHHISDYQINREEFNNLIEPLLTPTKDSVEKALKSADLEVDDIDRILLVGGSTKIPFVKGLLKNFFGREPYSDTDPDTAISRGAAILGATLLLPDPQIRRPEEDVPAFVIEKHDIVSHHLGIETVGGVFAPLLKKGEAIEPEKPTTANGIFTTPRDDMTELAIRVYQAADEVEHVSDAGVVMIGEFYLQGIPPKPARVEQISVKFEINDQNVLSVTASSSSSEQLEVLTLTTGAAIASQPKSEPPKTEERDVPTTSVLVPKDDEPEEEAEPEEETKEDPVELTEDDVEEEEDLEEENGTEEEHDDTLVDQTPEIENGEEDTDV